MLRPLPDCREKVRPTLLMRTAYWLTQPLVHLLIPWVLLLFAIRAIKEPSYLKFLASRFGFGPTGPKNSIWVYAASLGETRAASPLVDRLLDAGHTILLTHMSSAGLKEGQRLFGSNPRVTIRYVPLDLFWAMRLFLRRARPLLGIVLEIEIWPAMLMEAVRCGVPMVMANGNLLDESLARKRGARRAMFSLYQLFTRIFTRTEAYRQRYIGIGVPTSRIKIVGELRYDLRIPKQQLELGTDIRAKWAKDKPVLMIASSVKDEEPQLLDLVVQLVERVANLRIVWVPRSPQRFEGVATALESLGLAVSCRSQLGSLNNDPSAGAFAKTIPESTQVFVGDSIGEMFVYYSMADLVFVGASLVDHGGHNIVEPMAVRKPVVMGPSTFGVAFAAEAAGQLGAFQSLPDVAALADFITALFKHPERLEQMSRAASEFSATQTGAADRTYEGLVELLR